MRAQAHPYFASILLTFALTGFLTIYAWRQRRSTGARSYMALSAGECLLALAEILSMLAADETQALFWFDVRFLFLAAIPVCWLIFSLDFSGYGDWLSKRQIAAMFLVPAITQVLVWSSGRHDWWVEQEVAFHRNGFLWIAETGVRLPGFWYLVHSFYSLFFSATGILILYLVSRRSKGEARAQALLLTGSSLSAITGAVFPTINALPDLAFNPLIPSIGLGAVLVTLAALRFRFLKDPSVSISESGPAGAGPHDRRSLATILFIYVVLVSSLAAVGFVSYFNYERHFRIQMEAQLGAIADLKVSGLQNWRDERLEDANLLYENPAFEALVQRFLDDPADRHIRQELQAWLARIQANEEYDRVFLTDSQGRELLAMPPGPDIPDAHTSIDAVTALQTGQVTFLDFHHDDDNRIHLAVMVPIFASQEPAHPLGVLVMRIDPYVYLYPFIQGWPAPSTTAETLLVRREDSQVVFLNPLRFEPQAALNLRMPLSDVELPAVRAALGYQGVVTGHDYRKAQVVAAVRSIPGSPWFLVARIDTSEVYAPLRERLWQMVAFFGALILLAGTGLMLTWRQQQLRFYSTELASKEALRQSEEKFSKAFMSTPDSVTINTLSEDRFVSANHGFEVLTGYTENEVRGKTTRELGIWDNFEDHNKIVAQLQTKGSVQNFEALFRRKGGEALHGLITASLIEMNGEPHMLNILREISERKRTENNIRALLALVEYAAQHSLEDLLVRTLDEVCAITESPVGFYHLVDPDGQAITLQAWSTRTVREFCKAEGEGLHYPIGRAGVWADSVREKKPVIHNDYTGLPHRKGLPEGHTAVLRELVVPILRAGRVVAVLGVGNKPQDYNATDIETVSYFADVAWEIAERKRAENSLKAYSEKLEEMVEGRTHELREAQEKLIRQERLAVLGQLAGSVGHELRNPLGVISNAVFYLKMTHHDPDERTRDYLDIIDDETRTAEKIITDLLDFSRVKNADREPVSVIELVERTLSRFPAPANVRVALEVPDHLPPVHIDLHQMIQVLGNLTVNACQAMPDGGDLRIAARADGETVAISVSDTGTGIQPQHVPKLFEPLFTTKMRGIGLGLAVSRKLAEANGGKIEVQSEPGAGSTFTIYLPRNESKS